MESDKGIRSKYVLSGRQIDILRQMESGWTLRESGKTTPAYILLKGKDGGSQLGASRSSVGSLLRKGLITETPENPGTFVMTDVGHRVLKVYTQV